MGQALRAGTSGSQRHPTLTLVLRGRADAEPDSVGVHNYDEPVRGLLQRDINDSQRLGTWRSAWKSRFFSAIRLDEWEAAIQNRMIAIISRPRARSFPLAALYGRLIGQAGRTFYQDIRIPTSRALRPLSGSINLERTPR